MVVRGSRGTNQTDRPANAGAPDKEEKKKTFASRSRWCRHETTATLRQSGRRRVRRGKDRADCAKDRGVEQAIRAIVRGGDAKCDAKDKAGHRTNNHSAETDVKRPMEEGGEERATDADHEKAQNFPDTTARSRRGGQVHCSMREGGNIVNPACPVLEPKSHERTACLAPR